MTFVVTLIALLIERFFDWSHIRQWNWFLKWQKYISIRLQDKNPYLILGVAIIPLSLAIGLVSYVLHGVLYGVVALVFDLVVLLYCLGPRNLWAEIFATPRADEGAGRGINTIFIAANCRVLAVIFWYLLAGVLGAVLYRLLAVAAHDTQETPANVSHAAHVAEGWLDWLPVRFFTFLFALGGHFTKVFSCWRKRLPTGAENNDAMLTECGYAALGLDEQTKAPADKALVKSTVSLLDRTLVILLVIVAVAILLSY